VVSGVPDRAQIRAAVAAVVDPEIPVLTVADIGILRRVEVGGDGKVTVTITPTYSGCPATDVIRSDIEAVLDRLGVADHEVRTVLSPPWTTAWISAEAKDKLRAAGIAPPQGSEMACPHCGSDDTRVVSTFGSTACQALAVCDSCGEPFPHFKEF